MSEKGQTIVGRGEKCEVQLHDPSISRRHFCITKQDDKYFLQDMGSSNGTLINGKRTLWQELNEGDYIVCGSSQLKYIKVKDEQYTVSEDKQETAQVEIAPIAPSSSKATQQIKKIPSTLHIEEISGILAFDQIQQPSIDDTPADILIQKSSFEPPFSAHKDIERISKALATLYKTSELLHSQIELKKLLESLLEMILSVGNAERGCLLLKSAKDKGLEIAAYQTVDKTKISMLSISRTIVDMAIDKGLATVSSDAMADKRFIRNEKASVILHHIRSVMCVPLQGKSGTLGAIYLDSLKTCCAFDNEDLELLTAIGRQAGLAVERTLLQETISRSEQKYRTIFQKSPFSIVVLNKEGRFVDINPVGIQDLGIQEDKEIIDCSIMKVFPDAKEHFQKLLEQGNSFDLKELHSQDFQANNVIVNLKGIPLFDETGQVEGAVIISEDITEAKKLQAQLIQQDKMATVGLLAAGVAHEFNNIVAGMMGFTQLMQLGKKTPEKVAEVIVEQCRRARELIERLLNFSRRKDIPREPVQIAYLLEDVLQLVERELTKNNIQVIKNYSKVPSIIAHAGELQQVFLNLVINAVHAMGKDGTLTVSLWQEKKSIKISFQDTGIGIPAKNLPRIFEPFFTTKKQKGTGLGLSVSYNIIKSYDGDITLESVEGKGTTFNIELPITEDVLQLQQKEALEKKELGGLQNFEETARLQGKDFQERFRILKPKEEG
ncbi:MAG: FHA domain-containing protein [Candidatus Brocadiae bacterium]|nr:FHA domain-containing protein [Candidatus Brocadiia bacterium]